jgi:hypothetical protein
MGMNSFLGTSGTWHLQGAPYVDVPDLLRAINLVRFTRWWLSFSYPSARVRFPILPKNELYMIVSEGLSHNPWVKLGEKARRVKG